MTSEVVQAERDKYTNLRDFEKAGEYQVFLRNLPFCEVLCVFISIRKRCETSQTILINL